MLEAGWVITVSGKDFNVEQEYVIGFPISVGSTITLPFRNEIGDVEMTFAVVNSVRQTQIYIQ